jgi:hypothetical protein
MALSPGDLAVLAARVRVAPQALEFAHEHGGVVHVWEDDAGGAWLRLHAGVEPPPDDRTFQELRVGDGTILVSLSAVPEVLDVRLERWPRRRRLVALTNAHT